MNHKILTPKELATASFFNRYKKEPRFDSLNRRIVPSSPKTPPIIRFMRKIEIDETTGCWIWQGTKCKNLSYGQMRIDNRLSSPHRFAYEYFVRAIPHDCEIDHVCHMVSTAAEPRRDCCNPHHLDAVSHRVNCQRRLKRGN